MGVYAKTTEANLIFGAVNWTTGTNLVILKAKTLHRSAA